MKLIVEGLSFGYGAAVVGEDINFSLSDGEVLCLLGPNGAGKTTLFKTILGLLKPSGGTISIDGSALASWSDRQRAQKMAYVPQAHAALFPFSVLDVVLMGRAARLDLFSSPSATDITIANEALASLGLTDLAHRPYTEISGGQRQIVLIARALAQEPKLLVMDEPTASLDYGNQMRVLNHIRELARRGIAVILSTHNPDHAFLCADHVALFHERKIIAIGKPDDVLTPRALKQLYNIDVVIGSVEGSPAKVCAPVLSEQFQEPSNGA